MAYWGMVRVSGQNRTTFLRLARRPGSNLRALALELPSGMCCVALNPGVIDTDMLRSCFGDGASAYRGPDEWARRAVPFLLKIGPRDNGKSLNVPA